MTNNQNDQGNKQDDSKSNPSTPRQSSKRDTNPAGAPTGKEGKDVGTDEEEGAEQTTDGDTDSQKDKNKTTKPVKVNM